MKPKETVVLLIAVIVFLIAVSTAFGGGHQGMMSASSSSRFDIARDKYESKSINIKRDTELKLKVSSSVEKGSMEFMIISPDERVVYKNEGQTFYDIKSIPVTKGTWTIVFKTDYAEGGNCYYKAEARM